MTSRIVTDCVGACWLLLVGGEKESKGEIQEETEKSFSVCFKNTTVNHM